MPGWGIEFKDQLEIDIQELAPEVFPLPSRQSDPDGPFVDHLLDLSRADIVFPGKGIEDGGAGVETGRVRGMAGKHRRLRDAESHEAFFHVHLRDRGGGCREDGKEQGCEP